jgi:2-oxoglutarate ferredoxin oxidoreductase subunit delta
MAKEVNSKGYRYAFMAHAEACTGCTNCAIVCPDGVITVYRKKFES